MSLTQGAERPRPWTVTVLIVIMMAGLVWGWVSREPTPLTFVTTLVQIAIAFGLWRGARWAFTTTMALLVIATVALVLMLVFPEGSGWMAKVLLATQVIAFWLLLRHQETRRFFDATA
jgi:hypothetical protein